IRYTNHTSISIFYKPKFNYITPEKNRFPNIYNHTMKKIILFIFTLVFLQFYPEAQQVNLYFASYPTLTPDGKTMIYSYNGNLWRAAADGGFATQITSMQGNTIRAK